MASGCRQTARDYVFILKFTSENRLRDATIILVLANICESGFSGFFDWLFAFDFGFNALVVATGIDRLDAVSKSACQHRQVDPACQPRAGLAARAGNAGIARVQG